MNQLNSSDSLPNPLPVSESVAPTPEQLANAALYVGTENIPDNPPTPVDKEWLKVLPKTPDKFKFRQAKDGRGHAVPGIWVRNNRYYGQLKIVGKGCRRVSLFGENKRPVENLREAKEAYRLVLSNRDAGEMPEAKRGIPLFSEFHVTYTDWAEKMGKKIKLTVDKERRNLLRWAETLGHLPLNQITRVDINRHLEMRKDERCCNRTLNLDVLVLGNCLRYAKEELNLLRQLVTEDFKPLEHRAPKRGLLTEAEIEKICAESVKVDEQGMPVYPNGQQHSDYVLFMTYTGARRESAAFVKWADIDFDNRRVSLVKTKYSKDNMVVTFNPKLEKLLTEMKARRLDEGWLFPNPFDLKVQANFRKSFDRIRKETKLETFVYHDLRHFFTSHAVMDGIPYLTIAQWLGHTDGGVLIGKVYGHLSDSHLQEAAAKLTFGKREPTFVEAPAPAPANIVDLNKVGPAELLAILQKLQNPNASSTIGSTKTDEAHKT